MRISTKKLTTCAIFAAIICVVTTFVAVPAPAIGNINLGDLFILCSAWILGPVYGAIASGLGASLADLFSGFAIYAPATFFIKALMVVACYFVFSTLSKLIKLEFASRLISAFCAELIMILGYFAYESVIYGFSASIASVPFNSIQAVICTFLGTFVGQLAMKNATVKQFSKEMLK